MSGEAEINGFEHSEESPEQVPAPRRDDDARWAAVEAELRAAGMASSDSAADEPRPAVASGDRWAAVEAELRAAGLETGPVSESLPESVAEPEPVASADDWDYAEPEYSRADESEADAEAPVAESEADVAAEAADAELGTDEQAPAAEAAADAAQTTADLASEATAADDADIAQTTADPEAAPEAPDSAVSAAPDSAVSAAPDLFADALPEDATADLEAIAVAAADPEALADPAPETTADRLPTVPAPRRGTPAKKAAVGTTPAATATSDDDATWQLSTDMAPLPPLRQCLEAILLVVEEPVAEVVLAQITERPRDEVAETLAELAAEYTEQQRGFDLRQVAGGWRFYTRASCAPLVEKFVLDGQQARLSQPALETLAVVAYRQPVSRSRVSAVRGVNCDGVMRTLLTRGLVEEAGNDAESGAILYRTTPLFLEKMGMQSLEELPDLAPLLPSVESMLEEQESLA
jgi:segregation and condensation protein B